VLNEDLRFSCTGACWTVSINGSEFVPPALRKLRSGFNASLQTAKPEDSRYRLAAPTCLAFGLTCRYLTFTPARLYRIRSKLEDAAATFKSCSRALAVHFETRTPIKQSLGRSGTYPRFILGNRAVIAVDPDESTPSSAASCVPRSLWSRSEPGISVVVIALPNHRDRLHSMPALRANSTGCSGMENNRTP
jgi:hypothetical protein